MYTFMSIIVFVNATTARYPSDFVSRFFASLRPLDYELLPSLMA